VLADSFRFQKPTNGKPETRITIYPEANHDSWTQTFENEEIYNWLLLQLLE
jgi:predicted peptidase